MLRRPIIFFTIILPLLLCGGCTMALPFTKKTAEFPRSAQEYPNREGQTHVGPI